jgi:hypothetical protein
MITIKSQTQLALGRMLGFAIDQRRREFLKSAHGYLSVVRLGDGD